MVTVASRSLDACRPRNVSSAFPLSTYLILRIICLYHMHFFFSTFIVNTWIFLSCCTLLYYILYVLCVLSYIFAYIHFFNILMIKTRVQDIFKNKNISNVILYVWQQNIFYALCISGSILVMLIYVIFIRYSLISNP